MVQSGKRLAEFKIWHKPNMETLQRTANRGSISTGAYDIDNSLKVESDNREYLRWTNFSTYASSARKKKFSMSLWCKRTELGSQQIIWSTQSNGYLSFEADDEIKWYQTYSGVQKQLNTNRVFRDTASWYNIIVAVDSTQATEANRMRLYVNGVEETSFVTATYPSQNDEAQNIYEQHLVLGEWGGGATGFNGYIADYLFVSEVQLVPSDVGEVDEDTGIWKPKAYSGTISSPSHFLEFQDGSDLGTATSGLDADTMNNLTSADQATDTPTNNFCTMNPLIHMVSTDVASSSVIDGGTTISSTGANYAQRYGTIGLNIASGGKWYWEFTANTSSNGNTTECLTGLIFENRANENTASPAVYSDDFAFYGGGFGHGQGYAANVVNGFLLDLDNNTLKWYRDDSLHLTMPDGTDAMPTTGLVFPYGAPLGSSFKLFMNFGGYTANTVSSGNTDPNGYGNFEFDTKSGYALCTKNLAEFG